MPSNSTYPWRLSGKRWAADSRIASKTLPNTPFAFLWWYVLLLCPFQSPFRFSYYRFFFTSADAHCDGGHCIAANRCIRIVNRCCVPEHARSNHATDHRIGHLLGARGSGQIELALVEKLLPDLLRHYWIRARRLCQHWRDQTTVSVEVEPRRHTHKYHTRKSYMIYIHWIIL